MAFKNSNKPFPRTYAAGMIEEMRRQALTDAALENLPAKTRTFENLGSPEQCGRSFDGGCGRRFRHGLAEFGQVTLDGC